LICNWSRFLRLISKTTGSDWPRSRMTRAFSAQVGPCPAFPVWHPNNVLFLFLCDTNLSSASLLASLFPFLFYEVFLGLEEPLSFAGDPGEPRKPDPPFSPERAFPPPNNWFFPPAFWTASRVLLVHIAWPAPPPPFACIAALIRGVTLNRRLTTFFFHCSGKFFTFLWAKLPPFLSWKAANYN